MLPLPRPWRDWFSGKCILLVDDAWEENGSGCVVVAQLSGVVDTEEGSRFFVYET